MDARDYAYGEGSIPSTPILILRFPDGDAEYRSTQGELPVGVLVRSRGTLWRVRAHQNGTAFLEPASPEDAAIHGPVADPTPFGEQSITLETVVEI